MKYRVKRNLTVGTRTDVAHRKGSVVDGSVLEGHPEWKDSVEPVAETKAKNGAPASGEVEPVPPGQSPSAEKAARKAKETE